MLRTTDGVRAGERAYRTGASGESLEARGVANANAQGAHAERRARLTSGAWLLSSLTLLGLALRLAALRLGYVLTPDGVSYVQLARELAAGNFRAGMSFYWSPLYPMLVAVVSWLCRDLELAARLVSVIAGSLLVIPVHSLTRRAAGRRVARWAALLTALHPLLIYYSTQVLTESTYTLVFVCGVLAGWQALSAKRARTFGAAGMAFGACYLLKPEAAGFLLLLLVLTLASGLWQRDVSNRNLFLNCLALAAGFLLLALPYLIYLRAATGVWMLSAKLYGHLWQGGYHVGNAVATSEGALVPGSSVVLTQTARALRSEYELLNLIFPPTFVALAALGLLRDRWTRRRARRELYLLLFVAATLLGYAVTLPNVRFLVPLLPLTFGWVGRGAVHCERWLRRSICGAGREREERVESGVRGALVGRLPLVPVTLALAVLTVIPLTIYLFRGDKWDDYNGQKHAGLWIKEQRVEGHAPLVMSTVPIAAFYAGGEDVRLQPESYDSFLERARAAHADFIIVNERDIKPTPLRRLLYEDEEHAGLRLVHKQADVPSHKILVYALTN